MKHFLLFIFIALAVQSKATNDTLTRAQVYNFNVRDTFDYKIESQDGTLNGYQGINYDLISFQRIVVNAAQYFQLEDSLSVVEAVYETPNPTSPGDLFSFRGNRSVRSDSTSNYAAFDSAITIGCGYSLCSLSIDTGYNQRTVNISQACSGLGCYAKNYSYSNSLGIVDIYSYDSDGFSSWDSYRCSLIYFHKGTETWGTPATIVMGTNDIAANNATIKLYPTINNGQFQIKITNGNSTDYQLLVYDLTGRIVKRTTLKTGINDVALSNTSRGMYLWSVMSSGVVLKAGKLVVQ